MSVKAHIKKTDKERARKDVLNRLRRCPHLVECIFEDLEPSSILKTAKVSPLWKEIITENSIWERTWERMLTTSQTWKLLATRLEYTKPKLWIETEGLCDINYQLVFQYVEQNIKEISQWAEKHKLKNRQHIYFPMISKESEYFCHSIFPNFKVHNENVFIYDGGKVVIFNRWTKQIVEVLDFRNRYQIGNLHLADGLLGVHFLYHKIVIYDLSNFKEIQTLPDSYEVVGLSRNFLATLRYITIDWPFDGALELRRWDPSTRQFSTHVEKTFYIDFGHRWHNFKIYFDRHFLILDGFEDCRIRRIIVYDLNTMKQTKYRTFTDDDNPSIDSVKQESHNGVIIVPYDYDMVRYGEGYGTRFAAWNFETDTIQPITNFPSICQLADSQFITAAVPHNANYQWVIEIIEGKKNIRIHVFATEGWRCDSNPLVMKKTSKSLRCKEIRLKQDNCYFDGLQFLWSLPQNINLIDIIA